MISILLLIIGLAFIVLGANILVDGASSLAKKYHIPNIVIGLTIVAFGTSAPELVVSAYAAYSGNSDIAIGNVVGSNIFNIFLILGITAIITPLVVLKNTVFKEIPLSLLAAIILLVLVNDVQFSGATQNIISFGDGIVLLSFFIIFMFYLIHLTKNSGEDENMSIKNMSKIKAVSFIVGGLLLLVGGGKLFVDNAVSLALGLGMSKAVVGLTIVAAGTSLPELATSIVAALKKNADIAVGNIIGSNLFNIFFILGTSSLIAPLKKGNISDIDLYVCISASILLLLSCYVLQKLKITKIEGSFLLACYVAYVVYQVSLVV